MTKSIILHYLKNKKEELHNKYGIVSLGLYGSYARDEATDKSDIDIFYERDNNFELDSGLEFMNINEQLADDLHVRKVDFVSLTFMNPIIKYYAKKDFIYV
ncbi:MAG: nucleotidyltransferase [Sulfurimonas sp.]|nr:MAG: nucleotidyltransferase [Sulfurimonas sp.]